MYVNSGLGLWDRIGPIWRIAFEEAWAAYVAGTVPVGAVLVDVNGAIVSRGRNRIFDNAVAGHIGGSRLAHAEVNALLGLTGSSLDPRALRLPGGSSAEVLVETVEGPDVGDLDGVSRAERVDGHAARGEACSALPAPWPS